MDQPGIDIRALSADELPAVHTLWAAAGLPFSPAGRDDEGLLAAGLRAARTTLLGALSAGELVGVVLVSDDTRKGWLSRLAVAPAFRRHGVGLALVRAAERDLAARGLGMTAALVEAGNHASLALFAQAGYEARRDIVYLRRFLTPGW